MDEIPVKVIPNIFPSIHTCGLMAETICKESICLAISARLQRLSGTPFSFGRLQANAVACARTSEGTTPWDYAFEGIIRMREAINRAVQNNILLFLQALETIDLSKPMFPAKK